MTGFYHLSVSIIGRGRGRSAVACAAYRAGEAIADQRYGKTHDYTRRRGILAAGIIAPQHTPAWACERDQLWNGLESFEKRKDAQLAREFVLGLPHQLDLEQQTRILREFIEREITPRGLVADWAIHAPNRAGDMRNQHAHLMVTIRAVGEKGFCDKKDRSLNSPEQLQRLRQSWAEIQNSAFEKLQIKDDRGRTLRVDHRSFQDQGIDLEPTTHLGVHATAMERRGLPTELGDNNRRVRAANRRDLEPSSRRTFRREMFERRVEQEREAREQEGEHGL
jgi:ATP-dependent exoDNAse (exonuclease V) alpha subunit